MELQPLTQQSADSANMASAVHTKPAVKRALKPTVIRKGVAMTQPSGPKKGLLSSVLSGPAPQGVPAKGVPAKGAPAKPGAPVNQGAPLILGGLPLGG
jgi:hypothetical protein